MTGFHLYVESNEHNKLTKYKQTRRHREQMDSCQRRAVWGLGEKIKVLSKRNKTKIPPNPINRQQYGDYQSERGAEGGGIR